MTRDDWIEDMIMLVTGAQEVLASWGPDTQARAFEDDHEPGLQLTVGTDRFMDDWTYQTGDNSYSGPVYGCPYWAVVGIYADTSPSDLAEDIVDQLETQIASDVGCAQ